MTSPFTYQKFLSLRHSLPHKYQIRNNNNEIDNKEIKKSTGTYRLS